MEADDRVGGEVHECNDAHPTCGHLPVVVEDDDLFESGCVHKNDFEGRGRNQPFPGPLEQLFGVLFAELGGYGVIAFQPLDTVTHRLLGKGLERSFAWLQPRVMGLDHLLGPDPSVACTFLGTRPIPDGAVLYDLGGTRVELARARTTSPHEDHVPGRAAVCEPAADPSLQR